MYLCESCLVSMHMCVYALYTCSDFPVCVCLSCVCMYYIHMVCLAIMPVYSVRKCMYVQYVCMCNMYACVFSMYLAFLCVCVCVCARAHMSCI